MLGVGLNSPTLVSIRVCILPGQTLVKGKSERRLTDRVGVLMGHDRGGVGSTTVATAMVFGSVSGSAAATVSAIGRIMYPELRKNGYSERFSIGLIAAGSETDRKRVV